VVDDEVDLGRRVGVGGVLDRGGADRELDLGVLDTGIVLGISDAVVVVVDVGVVALTIEVVVSPFSLSEGKRSALSPTPSPSESRDSEGSDGKGSTRWRHDTRRAIQAPTVHANVHGGRAN
jgi:hypothetical protein